MRKNHKGFSPIETVLILVIVALVAFIAWYVFHAKSNTDTTYGNAANTQTEPGANSLKKSTSNTTTKTADIIQTKTDSKLGQYLADANGDALYTYGSDTDNTSNCTGSCLTDWPAYKATSSASLPANVSTITRSDGTTQYTYKKKPLYTFASDSAGQVTGDGVGGFSVAKP